MQHGSGILQSRHVGYLRRDAEWCAYYEARNDDASRQFRYAEGGPLTTPHEISQPMGNGESHAAENRQFQRGRAPGHSKNSSGANVLHQGVQAPACDLQNPIELPRLSACGQ